MPTPIDSSVDLTPGQEHGAVASDPQPDSLPAQTSVSYDYGAFISYRRRDGAVLARWLRWRLQLFELPPELLSLLSEEARALHSRKPRIYLDTAYEKPSDDFLTKKIYPALDQSRRLILISTPSVFESIHDADGREYPNWLVLEVGRFSINPALTLPAP